MRPAGGVFETPGLWYTILTPIEEIATGLTSVNTSQTMMNYTKRGIGKLDVTGATFKHRVIFFPHSHITQVPKPCVTATLL